MAALAGKGGNKGRAPKYSSAPATVGMYEFRHEIEPSPVPVGNEIPLRLKYRPMKGMK